MAVINCRILINKIPLFSLYIETHQCNVLFLTETWICDKTCPTGLVIPGFYVYMKNRIGKRGGGVAIMLKNDLTSSQVEIIHPEFAVFDLCCVDIKIDYKIYRLICIYRPPGVNDVSRHDADLLSTLLSQLLAPKLTFLVAGDLNLPEVN